jgi:hypothetical protein
MAEETLKYYINRNQVNGLFYCDVKRELNGEWNSIHVTTHLTMWGAKLHAKRWIKKWSKGKFRQHSYMNVVKVDRRW